MTGKKSVPRKPGYGIFQVLLANLFIVAVLIVILEAFLRIFLGYPRGIFYGWTPGEGGLYPENKEILMPGPIPYVIRTNSAGFRGDEISPRPADGIVRIAAIGDSITDGFFVDNDYTYPHLMEATLTDAGWGVEVINAAHGGGSIDKQLQIFVERVVQLEPDIVVLTFVTNDVADIAGKSRQELVNPQGHLDGPDIGRSPFVFLITRTAIGELFYDTYLSALSPAYRQVTRAIENPADRYSIAGGRNFEENSNTFSRRFRNTDGLILTEPLAPEVRGLLNNYFLALKEFQKVCERNGIELLFVYFPAYSQVYGRSASDLIQSILADKAATLGIPFLDLTPAFRDRGKNEVLHLAPLDFHPNPAGNSVIADEIAEFLIERILDRNDAEK